jgi:hypothetical protein
MHIQFLLLSSDFWAGHLVLHLDNEVTIVSLNRPR